MSARFVFYILFLLFPLPLLAQGEVYIVVGSDTGIWEGLDVNHYHHTYKLGLYTDPLANTHKVMDPAFRNQMKDTYGTPLKMTWWMMSGNTFRYAINKNVPHVNSVPLYLMKKYHGTNVDLNGDELSLHYHDWVWTDYDQDGKYYWNQALTFTEFKEDFEYTLAENLLEENMFPVSYRSGWHYMDNDWQNYLENILPFSMHNDYPAKHTDTVEPLDNTFDWSLSSSEFVPYHPAKANYQIPGELKGYDVRSKYMASFSQAMMNNVFDKASKGIDQVVCIWAHLPETDFLQNIRRVDSLIQNSAVSYPNVKFRYCTGVEAYQRWLKTNDHTPPTITLSEESSGGETWFIIQVDEQIFQSFPFLAAEDLYENYFVIPMEGIGNNLWRSLSPIKKSFIVKVGVAVTDTSGNLATKVIKYLPDDIFIDNADSGYHEIYGNWETSTNSSWGNNSRSVALHPTDSAFIEFATHIPQAGKYNIFLQFPEISNPQPDIAVTAMVNGIVSFEKRVMNPMVSNDWNYIGTIFPSTETALSIDIKLKGKGTSITNFSTDVLKISSLVKEREISVSPRIIEFGSFSSDDSASTLIYVENKGINELTIAQIFSSNAYVFTNEPMPVKISGMETKAIQLRFTAEGLGSKIDTLFILSDDSMTPTISALCTASLEMPFSIVDNETEGDYFEFGEWFTSVAQAYGPSSRYSYLNRTPKNFAVFSTILKHTGLYNIFEIVPKTVNASNKAFYILSVNGTPKDSIYVDQNAGSGDWVKILSSQLPKDIPVELKVTDTGLNTVQNAVLRADAVKFSLISETTNLNESISSLIPRETKLEQNFPNPFNPTTTISFTIPILVGDERGGLVTLKVYDILGNEVRTLINKDMEAAYHSVDFDASELPSGVYFYQLRVYPAQGGAGPSSSSGQVFVKTKKMVLLR